MGNKGKMHGTPDQEGWSGSTNNCLLKTLQVANVLDGIILFCALIYIIWNLFQGEDTDYLEAFIAFCISIFEAVFWAYTFWTLMRGTFGAPIARNIATLYVYVIIAILIIILIWIWFILNGNLIFRQTYGRMNSFEMKMQ